ncbi:hypothetical protein [Micromonospora globbae]|uniref:hypothetical protein n=1 Tax=Micromonospora globbae TaxID=1894969 RepID=UPI00195898BC|nr:hypothetical protein [Micromonospora globbae]
MNQTLDRRRLLATAALGGVVGATALGSLAPEAAFAAEATAVEPGMPDPNFAEGRISKISGNMLPSPARTRSCTRSGSPAAPASGSCNRPRSTRSRSVTASTPAAYGCPTARSPRTPSG